MTLLEFPIRRYQFTLVAFLCLIALGWYAFTSVPREEDPYFKIPGYTIAAIYPGADPEGPRAPGRQAHRRPPGGARRRDQDGNVDPRRRVVHRDRISSLDRRRQEIRRGHARGECAAPGISARRRRFIGRKFSPGPREHRADRAGFRRGAVPRARGLRAGAQGQAEDGRRRAHLGELGLPRARAARRASTSSAWPSSTSRPRS